MGRPLTDAERFGAEAAHGREPDVAEVRFDLPPGWSEIPATEFRRVHVRIDARPQVECYVSWLPGGAGGIAANVNRWRGQMGLAALDPQAVANLPRARLLDLDAVFVDMQGSYSGMDGAAKPGWRLAGMIADSPGGVYFLKMTGPRADVGAELVALRSFAASLRLDAGPTGTPSKREGTPPVRELAFDAPEGWVEGRARSTRVVTLHPHGDERTECYVTILTGSGGGELANLNRWRSQLGASTLNEDEVAALPKVRVLGKDCPLLHAEGPYVDMGGVEHPRHALLGTVRLLPQAALFVKLVGPADRVTAERERFRGFCESLRF